mmetsp:Transcript_2360/g.4980  ORF Transcript_2360/g.4980 Transcript_2360/m.4980 type:complete len:139 (+) Transcript_2360:236-652(+)
MRTLKKESSQRCINECIERSINQSMIRGIDHEMHPPFLHRPRNPAIQPDADKKGGGRRRRRHRRARGKRRKRELHRELSRQTIDPAGIPIQNRLTACSLSAYLPTYLPLPLSVEEVKLSQCPHMRVLLPRTLIDTCTN